MSQLYFYGDDGLPVAVSDVNPLPISGGGSGGGMAPEDVTATAPATWDAGTSTVGVDVGTGASQAAAGNHTHSQAQVDGLGAALADLDRVAAFVPNADGTDLTTLADAVDAIRDALVAAGLMAAA